MLEMHAVSVRRGKATVLADVSLSLPSGKLIVVVGPNGAGKSTLIGALSGELVPFQGSVHLDGIPLGKFSAHALAARRAVVPQATALAFPFTVREVVSLGASVPGFGLNEDQPSVDAALEAAEIVGLQHRLYTQLSGGERQRVHVARALCQLMASRTEPARTVLLLDEPTSSLDLPHQMLVMQQARAQARLGRTVVAVLHDLNLAATWADQVIAMCGGRMMKFGSPQDVLTQEVLSELYGVPLVVSRLPGSNLRLILPQTMLDHETMLDHGIEADIERGSRETGAGVT